MTSRLFVSVRPQETQIALWSADRLIEFRIEREGLESLLGNIYLGRMVRIERGLGAAFVDIGEAKPGFLPLDEVDGTPSEGEAVTVQVVREPREEKGARLTARPRLAGRLLRFDPRGADRSADEIDDQDERQRLRAVMAGVEQGGGFILRRAAAGADAAALEAEAANLQETWRDLTSRRDARPPKRLYRDDPILRMLRDGDEPPEAVIVDSRRVAEELRRRCVAAIPELADRIAFQPQRAWVPGPAEIRERMEEALEPVVPLPSGGSLLFEPGETLTAIDVNSGSQVGDSYGRAGSERALLRTNLEAAAEIARQIRLRNLGGILVVDFIDLRSRGHRRRVVEALRAAVSADPAPCRVGGMSPLGLVEMTRRRRGPTLEELLTAVCPTCDGRGRIRRDTGSGTSREGEPHDGS